MQAVEVRAPSSNRQHPYTFTFCLERIDVGPYKVTPLCRISHCMPLQHDPKWRFAPAYRAILSEAVDFWRDTDAPSAAAMLTFAALQDHEAVFTMQGCWMTVGLRMGDYSK